MKVKIKWLVDPEPTGRYRSFERRAWPSANYTDENETSAAHIRCNEEYDPRDIKKGKEFELQLYIADHSLSPWKWKRVTTTYKTVKECKEAFLRILKNHPHIMPKDLEI